MSSGDKEHTYTGSALVGLTRITLLDLVDDSLPNMIGQLDVSPGHYHLELRLVRKTAPALAQVDLAVSSTTAGAGSG